jgi:hypothetical protein
MGTRGAQHNFVLRRTMRFGELCREKIDLAQRFECST